VRIDAMIIPNSATAISAAACDAAQLIREAAPERAHVHRVHHVVLSGATLTA
jgi:hypothetical protein